ncbi:hypothetical protein C8R46DRAFT_1214008 [Mycena filopes]|nr:hypothetical protein C8R46DRAFT_1214008 [Mycena filopes]
MACIGKDGQSCSCTRLTARAGDKEDQSSKCAGCKHRKKYHTVPAGSGGGVSDVLAQFDLSQLRAKKVLEEDARKETNKGFRGGKDKDEGGSRAKAAKGGSTAAKTMTMVKVGSIQFIPVGIDEHSKPLVDKCPTPKDVEDMVDRHLAVYKAPDGNDLEFDLKWKFAAIDQWARAMLKPESGCSVFEFLDAQYGVPEGELDAHWVLGAKNSRKIFVRRGPVDGELLDTVKGTASGHRKYKEHAVRLVSRHRIPSNLTKNWDATVRRVTSGEELRSELEPEVEAKGKGKGKARTKPQRRLVESESEPEAESSELSELEEVEVKPELDTPLQRRHSSRLQTGIKLEAEDIDFEDLPIPRSPSSHSEFSAAPLVDFEVESEVEQHPDEGKHDNSLFVELLLTLWLNDLEYRKRSRSPSFDIEYLGTKKRARSESSNGPEPDKSVLQGSIADATPAGSSGPGPSTSTSTVDPTAVHAASSLAIPSASTTTPKLVLPPRRKGLVVPEASSNIWDQV